MDPNTKLLTGSATVRIERPVDEVFAAVSDISRMGEWSPECVACRWSEEPGGPAVGATFVGENVAKVGPVTLKRWTTTSEITEYEPNSVFEFVAEGYTTWRYEFDEQDGSTMVTESFSFAAPEGVQKFLYETVMRRSSGMEKGMTTTLERIAAALEA